MGSIIVPTNYYQHFDADFSLDVPGEGYGGWKREDLPISMEHTAVVVMHAWNCGTREQYPGWHRAVEYLPRSYEICEKIFPALLGAVRKSGLKLYHVVSSEDYCRSYQGLDRTKSFAGETPGSLEKVKDDEVLQQLHKFRTKNVFPGEHNQPDITRGFANLAFPHEAKPQGNEAIAATSEQLFALCRQEEVNHLIYTGFAINWCLLLSPGGMADMSKKGILCSAIRQAVTAVENKETARQELNKELALWRVALAFGFVYDADDIIQAIAR
ncbi:hypothetical protein ACFPYJ_03525 [Paenibacillus solisilvae]|uniref:Isochorismatase-like domain-containing protein n=1 Tax=Paenibacillus solisilvae TaxID=2486751 RepID=A0ABW0VSE3_9BACL